MTEYYEKALLNEERTLVEWVAKAEEAERKVAQLKQNIAFLKKQLGLAPDDLKSLTSTIILVLKAADGYVTAANVMEALFVFGQNAQTTSVATILSRLARQGKIVALDGPNGAVGYGWKIERTKAEKQVAIRELAQGFTKRRTKS